MTSNKGIVTGLLGLGVLAGLGYVVWTFVMAPKASAFVPGSGGGNTNILQTPVSHPITYNYPDSGSPFSGSIFPSSAYHVNISD